MLNNFRKKLNKRYVDILRKNVNLNRGRDIVLLGDHCIEEKSVPQDNYYLFIYLMECGQTVYRPYYVMNSKCPLYSEAREKYGEHIIPYEADRKKFKMQILSLMKEVKIICDSYQIFHHIIPGFTLAVKNSPYVYAIFTQHGVNFFKEQFVNKKSFGTFMFDKVMVCNDYEKNIFVKRGLIKEQNIIQNGLFRWDYITPNDGEKVIFVFFTHRRYLAEVPKIKESVYFKTVVALIEKLLLSPVVTEAGYRIKVALHHSVVDKFGYDLLNGVEVVKDEDIEKVKSEADVLITDYSSMCFEVWYQYKPVIFLHIHDAEDCLKYNKITDLVNPYAEKEQYLCNIIEYTKDCVEKVEDYVRNGFVLTEKERNSRNKFFYFNSDYRKRFAEYMYSLKGQSKNWYDITLNERIHFNEYADLFTNGVDMPNDTGRWTVEKKASIAFYLPNIQNDLHIGLNVIPNVVGLQKKLPLKIYVNGIGVYETVFTKREEAKVYFSVDREIVQQSNYLELVLQFSKCKMQKDLHPNCADIRYFGVNLLSMIIADSTASLVEPKENIVQEELYFFENDKSDLYRKVYAVMNKAALDADLYLDFYEDVFAYNAVCDNRIVDVMELSKCRDNKAFTQLAYLMLLRRLPDERAYKGLEKQYSLKTEEFQSKLINRILSSQEFKNLNIKVKNNKYFKATSGSGNTAGKNTNGQKAGSAKQKKGLKEKLIAICRHQPTVLKNIEKRLLKLLGIKW